MSKILRVKNISTTIYLLSQYFRKEQFDLFDNQCDVLRAAFCDSLDVFFTRLERLAWSQQGLGSSVSAENVIKEAFVELGALRWGFTALLAWRKGKVDTSPFFILPSFSTYTFPFLRESNAEENQPIFQINTKAS